MSATLFALIVKSLEVILFPLIGVLASYLIGYIRTKTKNAKALKYIDMLDYTVQACVNATNQTYVSSLKACGEFNKEAQEYAFEKTYKAVQTLLTEESKKYLNEAYGDFETLVKEKIEATVLQNK